MVGEHRLQTCGKTLTTNMWGNHIQYWGATKRQANLIKVAFNIHFWACSSPQAKVFLCFMICLYFIVWFFSTKIEFTVLWYVHTLQYDFFFCQNWIYFCQILPFMSSLKNPGGGSGYHIWGFQAKTNNMFFCFMSVKHKAWCSPVVGEHQLRLKKMLKCKIYHLFSELRIYEYIHVPYMAMLCILFGAQCANSGTK